MSKESGYTGMVFSEIRGSIWDGEYFQIPSDGYMEILDETEALARWLIQPKAGDSFEDFRIIHEHNRTVLGYFRDLGIDIVYSAFLEGETDGK